ncbi:TetR/AcrR family transcriptional regulator [Alicyclobacillus acidoterrestris]|uniref:TetR/AcrR family transcriptional regulator n=1 Tax=Alicyclobacillus acidoterrestris TaxID=1450 RepID=UPI003F533EF2
MEKKSVQREQILQEARRLFSQKGYHGTKIRDIANARGILSGSLYSHISSKEDLLFEIASDGAKAFVTAIQRVANSSMSPTEKVRAGLAAHIRVISNQLDVSRVFLHEWHALSDERRDIIQQKRDEYERYWKDILESGVQAGEFVIADPKFARLLILSVANWVYNWYQPDGELTPEDIADRFANVILFGLRHSE